MGAFARFPARLQQAIVARLRWPALRPVQDLSGAAILDGKNCVVLAPTAGGKTEAAMFPVLAGLLERPTRAVGALYIAPIKALLNNQEDRLGLYPEMVGLRRFLWHGDIPQNERKKFLREPTELLMTTPESLEVMLISPRIPARALFADLRVIVIDEVHAMAGTDRGAHLMSVLERLARFTPNDIQRIGLSATVGDPAAILRWLGGTSRREGLVIDPPHERRTREIAVHLDATMHDVAVRAAARAEGKKSLFFCESRAGSEDVADQMRGRGTEVFVHHSSVSLEERRLAEDRFERGKNTAIVCTSTLELGIDVGDLDCVFQANAPSTVSSFMQRMGRTGRRGGNPNTTFFCDDPESLLQAIGIVELAREGWVEPVPPQTRCWPAFVHQLFAMTLQFGGVGRERAWEQLSRVPDFSGIDALEYGELIDSMVRREYLFESGGLLSLGARAEKVYGRKNFMELYSVFSTPQYYRVLEAGGREIGSLEQSFVDDLVEEMTSFLLGGRAWVVVEISHRQRTVTVRPAPRGKKPSWGGFAPKLLGFELCQRIRRVLTDDAPIAYLADDAAVSTLAGYRDDYRALLSRTGHAVQLDAQAARWWTFAGGRINQTLRLALQHTEGWKIVADNFHLRIEGDGLSHTSVESAIHALSQPTFWTDLDAWERILASLPPYRLSKFHEALPPRFQQEMVGRYLLDIEGAQRFLGAGGGAADEALLRASLARAGTTPPDDGPASEDVARPKRPIRHVTTIAALESLAADLAHAPFAALDVETTLLDRELCTLQVGTADYNAIVDVLAVRDLSALVPFLESDAVQKLIHNAGFERSVLARSNLPLANVFDTMTASRRLRGKRVEGGHDLAAVCKRELGITLDERPQRSDWTRRPLTEQQVRYAAMDVEVLVDLHDVFARPTVD